MKRILFLIAALSASAHSWQPDVQTWTKQIRPGVTYTQEVRFKDPLVLHVLRFKYPAEGLRLQTCLAKDAVYPRAKIGARETVYDMAKRNNAIAAVNADFFGWDGDPLGVQVSRGQMISEPYPPRTAAAWADSGLLFDAPQWRGQLLFADGTKFEINGVNRSARSGEAILNTSKAGTASSKENCYAFLFELKGGTVVGKTLTARFRNVFTDSYNLPVGADEAILMVTQERAKKLLPNMHQGMEYEFRFDLTGTIDWKSVKEAVGGGPRLVKDGKAFVTYDYERFDRSYNNRHPRTAIGVTASGDAVLCVVDGRSSISRGVTLDELAAIMVRLGCKEAINLDGGGSSTFYLGGLIINRPSDGAMRPVANAILLVDETPPKEPAKISISAKAGPVLPGDATTLKLLDETAAEIPQSEVLWSCTGGAWVDGGGTLRALAAGKVTVRAAARGGEATLDLQIIKSP